MTRICYLQEIYSHFAYRYLCAFTDSFHVWNYFLNGRNRLPLSLCYVIAVLGLVFVSHIEITWVCLFCSHSSPPTSWWFGPSPHLSAGVSTADLTHPSIYVINMFNLMFGCISVDLFYYGIFETGKIRCLLYSKPFCCLMFTKIGIFLLWTILCFHFYFWLCHILLCDYIVAPPSAPFLLIPKWQDLQLLPFQIYAKCLRNLKCISKRK